MSMKEIAKKVREDAFSNDPVGNLPAITEPRCNVCKSEFRPIIDRMILGPYTYATIARQFMGKDQHLAGKYDAVRKSIERHAKSHVNVRSQAIREIMERRAIEQGMLVDDEKATLLTIEGMLELYIHKGYEQINEDGAVIRHQDILEAAKMLEDIRRNSVGEQIDVMKRQVAAISQAIREIVPPEMHPGIAKRAQEIFQTPIIDVKIKYTPEAMHEEAQQGEVKELVA